MSSRLTVAPWKSIREIPSAASGMAAASGAFRDGRTAMDRIVAETHRGIAAIAPSTDTPAGHIAACRSCAAVTAWDWIALAGLLITARFFGLVGAIRK